jgi:xanthine dehydrogenase accessory factor
LFVFYITPEKLEYESLLFVYRLFWVNFNPKDYVVIMTRGHKHDYTVLVQALRADAFYIGMIGSKTKVAETCKRLAVEENFSQDDIQRIYSPIGLYIKAESPAEMPSVLPAN